VITWVGTPGEDATVPVTTADQLENAVFAKKDRDGIVSLWTTRQGQAPQWLTLTIAGATAFLGA